MVKSIISVSINTELLIKAKEKALNMSQVMEKALTEILNDSAAGAKMQEEIQKTKNILVLRRLYDKKGKSPIDEARFRKALEMFSAAYQLSLAECMLIAEGKKE